MLFLRLYLVAFSVLLDLALAARQCYFPNGSRSNDTACTNDAVSVCCQKGAACLGNGLCYSPNDPDASAIGGYIRGSCTDQTWASQGCPNFCKKVDRVNQIFDGVGGAGVYNCGNNGWCCESDQNCICQTGNGTFQLQGSLQAITTIGSVLTQTTTLSTTRSTSLAVSSSPTSSTSSTFTVASEGGPSTSSTDMNTIIASVTATALHTSQAHGSGLTTGAKLGFGVGIPMGLIAIGLGVAFLISQRLTRKKLDAIARQSCSTASPDPIEEKDPYPQHRIIYVPQRGPGELYMENPRQELP